MEWLKVSDSRWVVERKTRTASKQASETKTLSLYDAFQKGPVQHNPAVQKHQVLNVSLQWNGETICTYMQLKLDNKLALVMSVRSD